MTETDNDFPRIYGQHHYEFESSSPRDLEEFRSHSAITENLTAQDIKRHISKISQRFDALNSYASYLHLSAVVVDDKQQAVAKSILLARFQNSLYGAVRLMEMGLMREAYTCLSAAVEVHALFALVKHRSAFSAELLSGEASVDYSLTLDRLREFGINEPSIARDIRSRCSTWGDKGAFSYVNEGKHTHLHVAGLRNSDFQEEFVDVAATLADAFILLSSDKSFSEHETLRRAMLANMYRSNPTP